MPVPQWLGRFAQKRFGESAALAESPQLFARFAANFVAIGVARGRGARRAGRLLHIIDPVRAKSRAGLPPRRMLSTTVRSGAGKQWSDLEPGGIDASMPAAVRLANTGPQHEDSNSVVAFGQRRALVVWQRIIFPDGSSIRLDNAPATDPSGYAGLTDKVDFHTWALLKGVVLSTLLGVGSELQFSGESDLVQAVRQSTQQSVSRTGDQLTSRNLQIQPTITMRPGAPVRLLVHHDLVLKPWMGE